MRRGHADAAKVEHEELAVGAKAGLAQITAQREELGNLNDGASENGLHWALDMTFDGDRTCNRKRSG